MFLRIQRERWAQRATLISGIASAACAVGFVLWALQQQLPDPPTRPGPIAAGLLALVAYGLATLWMCERWTQLLRRIDQHLPRVEGYWSGALGLLGNACLPIRAGDAIRVGLASTTSEKVSARSSVGVLVAERALDMSCHLVLLVIVCLGLFGPSPGGPLGSLPAIVACLVLLAAGSVAVVRVSGAFLSRWRPGWRGWAFLMPVFEPLRNLRHGSARVISLSVGIWLAEIVGWWAAAQAVDLELDPLQAAYVFAVASLALIAPIGFAAIGTLDAAILISVKAVGVSTAEALGFVLLLRMVFVLPSALVAVFIWLGRRLGTRLAGPVAGQAPESLEG